MTTHKPCHVISVNGYLFLAWITICPSANAQVFYCVQLSYIVPIVELVIYFGQLYYHEAII